MNMKDEALGNDLHRLADLLHKYRHQGQADVVDQIRRTLETSAPDYERLKGIDMWGGSGAVWEVCLTPRTSREQKADEQSFLQTIISSNHYPNCRSHGPSENRNRAISVDCEYLSRVAR
jgi:hypothetical protein